VQFSHRESRNNYRETKNGRCQTMIDSGDKLMRSARLLRIVTIGAMAVVAAATALGAWTLVMGPPPQGAIVFQVDAEELAPWPAAMVLGVVGALVLLALLQITVMLGAVERGAPFRSGARLRAFALYLFLALLAASLLPTLLQWGEALFLSRPRRVTFSISGEAILMLFVTGLLFFIGRLLEEAQRLAEDHQQIV
jgi:hypothetical protein